jgi:endonuclease/exonuclease/phosphatase (EEP) superfamily protein YafD
VPYRPSHGEPLVSRRIAFRNATLRFLAIAYPLALIAIILAFRLIGERWWVTTVALYLPRLPFALPLLPLTAAIIWIGPRRLLWTQALAAMALLMLMGFHFAGSYSPAPGAFRLRVLSCNINTGSFGIDTVIKAIRTANPDVILLQEVESNNYDSLRAGLAGYSISEAGQFWLASRFPVQDVMEPPKLMHQGAQRSLRFVRYRIVTPAGLVALYNVHPVSPRDGLEEVRGNGLRHQMTRGSLFNDRARAVVIDNTKLRMTQLEAIVTDARQSDALVVIAGDTNLPGLSWAFAHWLGDYRDGFSESGTGLGYTFPSPRHPWMRIDRILADARWQFLDFQVIDAAISDHYAVVADLQLPGVATAAQARFKPRAP